MKKGLTEIVFILDRSGSMSGLEADTIGGFNGMLKKQRKQDGEALVSTVLFDDVCDVIHDRVPKAKYDVAEQGIKKRRAKAERLDAFVTAIKEQGTVVTEFDEGLWGTLVDFMTIYSKEDISVTFKDGTEIHIG